VLLVLVLLLVVRVIVPVACAAAAAGAEVCVAASQCVAEHPAVMQACLLPWHQQLWVGQCARPCV
jgi:hypothetical protein